MNNYNDLYLNFRWYIYLLVAICIINSFSFPWPKSFGVPEFLIACFLFITFMKGYLDVLVKPNISHIFVLFFIILSCIGLFTNSVMDVSRDVISYIYLGIPIAFYYSLRKQLAGIYFFREKYDLLFFWFLISFSCVGLIYSLRSIWPFALEYGFDFSAIYRSQLFPHTDYIFLDPSLLFGACFLAVLGVGAMKERKYASGFSYLFLSLVIISAPFIASIRAPVFMYLMVLVMAIVFHYRIKALFFLPLLGLVIALFSGLAENILLKHSQEGANAKIEEAIIIFEYMLDRPLVNFIFGNGFGGTYYSTILHAEVRFSHNLFTYSLFKGGMLLLTSVIFIFLWLMVELSLKVLAVFESRDSLAFAALLGFFSSFLVSSLLEPGYKTLDYGLLLTVYVYFVLVRTSNPLLEKKRNENINNINQLSS